MENVNNQTKNIAHCCFQRITHLTVDVQIFVRYMYASFLKIASRTQETRKNVLM